LVIPAATAAPHAATIDARCSAANDSACSPLMIRRVRYVAAARRIMSGEHAESFAAEQRASIVAAWGAAVAAGMTN